MDLTAAEYNAITKSSIRMELGNDTRTQLRAYMNNYDKRVKTGNLLAALMKETEKETGYWDLIKYCMMQDVLYMHTIQSKNKLWREDGFIGSLMEKCSLVPEQIETIEKALHLNQEMLHRDADMEKLKKDWKTLIKSIYGSRAYVPTPYLFCFGSMYGAETCNEFLRKEEKSQKAVNKQRELILQEIIIRNQKAVNVLIGDMNYLAEKLEEALRTADEIKKDYSNITQLLSRIKSAVYFVHEEECANSVINCEKNREMTIDGKKKITAAKF